MTPDLSAKTKIAVVMTCFNRRELTLAGLSSLYAQTGVDDVEFATYLVDDGSTDGTGDAIRAAFPQVRVITGDGSLYWNGGMRKAFAAAMEVGYDAYIWFNDDTALTNDAMARILRCSRDWTETHAPAIIVGSVRDAITGKHTYGGFAIHRQGLSMELRPVVTSLSEPVRCDSMNGNFVLIPKQIVAVLGNLEPRFRHQIGDVDYGLRARTAGFDVVLAPGYFGFCSGNSSQGTWRDTSIPFRKRWKSLMSPKGAPVSEWLLYTRRHYGWRWPLYAVSPYLKTVVSSFAPKKR